MDESNGQAPPPRKRPRGLGLPGPGGLFVLGALALAPLALSRAIVGASWLACALAIGAWYGLLFVLLKGGSRGPSRDEAFGWTLIISLFTAWAGIPLIAAVLSVFI